MNRRDAEEDMLSLERSIGRVLRTGVLVSAFVVAIGGLVYLLRHGLDVPVYSMFHGEPADLRGPGSILNDAAHLSGRGIIQCGLLLLIATPIARVVFASWFFLRERDWVYVVIGLAVLTLLSIGIIVGPSPG